MGDTELVKAIYDATNEGRLVWSYDGVNGSDCTAQITGKYSAAICWINDCYELRIRNANGVTVSCVSKGEDHGIYQMLEKISVSVSDYEFDFRRIHEEIIDELQTRCGSR